MDAMVLLHDKFEQVASLLRESNNTGLEHDVRLRLYGLYKQATVGTCDTQAPIWDVKARYKYEAWDKCRGMTTAQAMEAYIELAADSFESCRGLYQQYLDHRRKQQHSDARSTSPHTTAPEKTDTGIETYESTNKGIFRSFLPRGQLDISYSDLAWACYYCTQSYSKPRYHALNEKIQAKFPLSNAVVGRSVRSLLDLYLTAHQYPVGSQVLVTPPITVPGMVHVLKDMHGLDLVGVDLPDDNMCVADIAALEASRTDRTVAVLVVHVFGNSVVNDEWKDLRQWANQHNLEIWEDAAECYSSLEHDAPFHPSISFCEVSFLSFGMIKTATALGGGIALVQNETMARKMESLQNSIYTSQTNFMYTQTVVKAWMLRCVTDFPILCGMFYFVIMSLGFNYDRLVSSWILSFPEKNARKFIRQRPCTALLNLLLRRLKQSPFVLNSVNDRIKRCRQLDIFLREHSDLSTSSISLASSNNIPQQTNWLYPVRAVNVATSAIDAMCEKLRWKDGIDATRGSSRLYCIATDGSCPRSEQFMSELFYLPTKFETPFSVRKLATSVAYCFDCGSKNLPFECKARLRRIHIYLSLGIVVSVQIGLSWLGLGRIIPTLATFVMSFYITGWLFVFGISVALRIFMSSFYLESCDIFAKYCPILDQMQASQYSSKTTSGQDKTSNGNSILNSSTFLQTMDVLSLTNATKDGEGPRKVVLAGATGYIGSLLLRDLLLHRHDLAIEKVVVLCRSKRQLSAEERIRQLLANSMFGFLEASERFNIVDVIEADLTLSGIGVSEENLKRLTMDPTITHVINAAASVSFTQSLSDAAKANITSALNLQKFATSLANHSAHFVHISTAFVHGGLNGTQSNPLPELLFPLGKYDPCDIYQSMLKTEYEASKAMREMRFPNTYVFSKSICEHLLVMSNVRTTIVRPPIVGPSAVAPYEGWAGSKPSTLVAAACLYMKYQFNIWGFGSHEVPVIPVDVLSMYILARTFDPYVNCDGEQSDTGGSTSSNEDSFEHITCSNSSRFMHEPVSVSTKRHQIYNAAWDSEFSPVETFTWIDFAVVITKLGSVKGYFSRPIAFWGLWLSTWVLPRINLTEERFLFIHEMLVLSPFRIYVFTLELFGYDVSHLRLLQGFLDLPLLFYPFMNEKHYFQSDLRAPPTFDGKRYLFTCVASASEHIECHKRSNQSDVQIDCLRSFRIGGKHHSPDTNLLWSFTQPRGSFITRLVAWLFALILRRTCSEVTVDLRSFSEAISTHRSTQKAPCIVLAPTHRSFFDFLLLSYFIFSVPELNLPLPVIVAAEEFKRIPFLGFLVSLQNVIFVRRDSGLDEKTLVNDLSNFFDKIVGTAVFEVYIEGTRSRDRRFVKPKSGFLKRLKTVKNEEFMVIPVTVNYERIPEHSMLAQEAVGGTPTGMKVRDLVQWLMSVWKGKVQLGRIHVTAGNAILVQNEENINWRAFVNNLQRRQRENIVASSFHVSALSRLLHVEESTAQYALVSLGCKLWGRNLVDRDLDLPSESSDLLLVSMHVLPFFAELVYKTRPHWGEWLFHLAPTDLAGSAFSRPFVKQVVSAIINLFDNAEACVDVARAQLKGRGFDIQGSNHLFQVAQRLDKAIPPLLLHAAIKMKSSPTSSRIKTHLSKPSDQVMDMLISGEQLGKWGFADCGFVATMDKSGKTDVTMKGCRYTITGKSIPGLLPFIEGELDIKVDLNKPSSSASSITSDSIPQPLLDRAAMQSLQRITASVSVCPAERIRHGFGHSQVDMCRIRCGDFGRIPDAVVWPFNEYEVEKLVNSARDRGWCLIPFGGGTNVSQATTCPSFEDDPRPIISLDMKKMSKLLSINEEDRLAHVEAGITGTELEQVLRSRGYTVGHEPDSIEFSTLGGWIATKASGMKRRKYGNIEDIVASVRVVGAKGVLHQFHAGVPASGRVSTGLDLASLMFGSEGCLGIITSAVIRIHPIPEVVEYGAVILPCFELGLAFSQDIHRLDRLAPASCRLLDSAHFRLGQSLQPNPVTFNGMLHALIRKMQVAWKFSRKTEEIVCVTVIYEGKKEEIAQQKRAIANLINIYGGVNVGPTIGKSVYQSTFLIAYLRDFALTYSILGESFEAFVPWSKVLTVVKRTKNRINEEHTRRCLPGNPFVGYRVTQLYHEGVCIYFYFCMSVENVPEPSKTYADIETIARETILESGGSLSHHHGIGKVRSALLSDVNSPAFQETLKSMKSSIDPENTFGARNGPFAFCLGNREK